MTALIKPTFKITTDSYGPSERNRVYTITINGVRHRITRHHWLMPTGWGWRIERLTADGNVNYEETIAYFDYLNDAKDRVSELLAKRNDGSSC